MCVCVCVLIDDTLYYKNLSKASFSEVLCSVRRFMFKNMVGSKSNIKKNPKIVIIWENSKESEPLLTSHISIFLVNCKRVMKRIFPKYILLHKCFRRR